MGLRQPCPGPANFRKTSVSVEEGLQSVLCLLRCDFARCPQRTRVVILSHALRAGGSDLPVPQCIQLPLIACELPLKPVSHPLPLVQCVKLLLYETRQHLALAGRRAVLPVVSWRFQGPCPSRGHWRKTQ